MTAEALANLIKKEVMADVESGVVAADIGGLAELLHSVQYSDDSNASDFVLGIKVQSDDEPDGELLTTFNAAMDGVDRWIKSGGIAETRGSFGTGVALLRIDQLIQIEGDEPALRWSVSLNQFLRGGLSGAVLEHIHKDIDTIEYWRGVYEEYRGREEDLLTNDAALINVFEPAIRGKRIADGFHRLAAAKLAGLDRIGARIAPWFGRSA